MQFCSRGPLIRVPLRSLEWESSYGTCSIQYSVASPLKLVGPQAPMTWILVKYSFFLGPGFWVEFLFSPHLHYFLSSLGLYYTWWVLSRSISECFKTRTLPLPVGTFCTFLDFISWILNPNYGSSIRSASLGGVGTWPLRVRLVLASNAVNQLPSFLSCVYKEISFVVGVL